MEHLAGGRDRRARGLRRVARLLAHGPGQTVRYLPLIPGSRFSPLLMAGHAPQSDRPATIARLVEETAGRAAGRTAPLRAVALALP